MKKTGRKMAAGGWLLGEAIGRITSAGMLFMTVAGFALGFTVRGVPLLDGPAGDGASWTVLGAVVLALGGRGNVDHVVMTPAGVWVVETKAAWLSKSKFRPALRQAAKNAQRVRHHLGSSLPVRAALVIAAKDALEEDCDWKDEPVKVVGAKRFWCLLPPSARRPAPTSHRSRRHWRGGSGISGLRQTWTRDETREPRPMPAAHPTPASPTSTCSPFSGGATPAGGNLQSLLRAGCTCIRPVLHPGRNCSGTPRNGDTYAPSDAAPRGLPMAV